MEVPSTSGTPAVVRYVYPGVTPRNGRLVTAGTATLLSGGEIRDLLANDGVDVTRWQLRFQDKRNEGWARLEPDTMIAFDDPDRMRLDVALEPVPRPADARRLQGEDERDGYFGIGVVGGKNEANQGTLWRSAWTCGAAFTFTIAQRFTKSSADTVKVWTSLPAYAFEDWSAFASAQPHACSWVAVEMGTDATPLEEFEHPDRAIYVLGSEDNGLPSSVMRACAYHVALPAAEGRTASFNVAACGSVVMYDRVAKRRRAEGGDARLRQGDSLPGGRVGVDSAKPSQVLASSKA
jgi:tRNA(Leu) C34 or U34 (ribose-2'-O)-methylase TrmL